MVTAAAVVLALAQAVPAAPAPAAPDPSAWTADLNPMGWKYLGSNDTEVAYSRPAPPGQAYARVWVRYEMRDQTTIGYNTVYLSSAELDEADCTQLRLRTLQWAVYSGRNMTGVVSNSTGSSPWAFATPGTFAEFAVKTACAVRRREPGIPIHPK
jgi:hypothetical protein